jgi:hypothetical protein
MSVIITIRNIKGNINIFLVGAVLVFIVIVGYLIYSQDKLGMWGINQKPVYTTETGNIVSDKISLEVSAPVDGSTLNSASVVVKGKTSPGAEVFVNDKETKADSSGNFSIMVSLDEGENQIVVIANDADGNTAEKDLVVTVETFK